jgi:hypothetical protein
MQGEKIRFLCLPHKLNRTWKEIGRLWKFLEHFVKNDKLKEFLRKHMDLERPSNKTFFMWDGKATSTDSLHWMNPSKWRGTTQCSVFDSFWQYKQACRATNCHNIFEQVRHLHIIETIQLLIFLHVLNNNVLCYKSMELDHIKPNFIHDFACIWNIKQIPFKQLKDVILLKVYKNCKMKYKKTWYSLIQKVFFEYI